MADYVLETTQLAKTPGGITSQASAPATSFGTNNKLKIRNSRITLPNRANVQRVMATPPTITSGATSAMTTPFYRPLNSGNTSFAMPGSVIDFAAVTRGDLGANVTVNNTPQYLSTSIGLSFMHEGSAFELVIAGTGNYYLIKVDDQYVSLTPRSTGASGALYEKFDFASVGRRRIDIIGQGFSLTGVNIGQTDTLTPAPIRGPSPVIMLGDSFTATAVNASGQNYTLALGDALAWDNLWCSGVGGTGYLNTNGGTAPTFRSRLAHDVFPYSPEVVWVVGSINDDNASPSAMATEAALLYSAILAGVPGVLLIVSPTASKGVNTWTANKLAVKAAMKSAALSAGAIWVDPLELPLWLVAGASAPANTVAFSASSGATTIAFNGTALTTGMPQIGGTFEVGSGATLERVNAKTVAFAGSAAGQYYYNLTIDGTLQYAHSAGESWKQVGGAYITGKGRVGATTGFGNSDLYCSVDGTHPSVTGYTALGMTLADMLIQALAPN